MPSHLSSDYRFTLSGYHAIELADIHLNGITVIAGCNGCGKSTIARWLYAFINYSNRFSDIIDRQLHHTLNLEMRQMARVIGSLPPPHNSEKKQFRPIPSSTFKDNLFGLDFIDDYLHDKIHTFCEIIATALHEQQSPHSIRRWIGSALGIADDNSGVNEFLADISDRIMGRAMDAIETARAKKEELRYQDLTDLITKDLDIYNDVPHNMRLVENGRDLIDGEHFITPIGLRNAVYIDTPMALSTHDSTENAIWNNLMETLTASGTRISPAAVKLATRIRHIIGGHIEVYTDDYTADIRYVRKEDGLDISIDEAATGLKTFAYMLRLIENGQISGDSILIIDEPEAHLHPQWIVEFARILVLLNKDLGTKILLASHNPDMVAAIQSISRAEGLAESTSFYQAHRDADNSLRYSYKYLGDNIEEIFRSFNIALERIQDYGC